MTADRISLGAFRHCRRSAPLKPWGSSSDSGCAEGPVSTPLRSYALSGMTSVPTNSLDQKLAVAVT